LDTRTVQQATMANTERSVLVK